MGLTNTSVGRGAIDGGFNIAKRSPEDKVIALAGNPNVGKSTIFNSLTGMKQHTGNWPGKTVANAFGFCKSKKNSYILVDIPGTYSLMAHSAEEEVARNFICFGETDAVMVVCDATRLERNLNLVLQTMEISQNVIVCVNLMDEARKKGITPDLTRLSEILGVPVVGAVGRSKKSVCTLLDTLDIAEKQNNKYEVKYDSATEQAIDLIKPALDNCSLKRLNSRWLALKIIENDKGIIKEINDYLGYDIMSAANVQSSVYLANKILKDNNFHNSFEDRVVSSIVKAAEKIAGEVVEEKKKGYSIFDRRMDKILTSKVFGYPIMLIFLALVFWITIVGANYPSDLLSNFLFSAEDKLSGLFIYLGAPEWLRGAFVEGVYRVLAWVVSVMLPPMAIFFPLFTLLEDSGYLPRIAYNLDKPFKKCNACGKQALAMCMGFGCNAAGVVGCRIIDSPRERLLAILTNNFVPCNGRFPTIITLISIFFISASGIAASAASALLLTAVILFGIFMTFAVTKLLSRTLLKGVPSSFTLELPSYRRPQIGKVIVRSIFDRTLFVLGRAVSVAAPAGLVIWLFANVQVGDVSLLKACADFFDPFARLFGLDGVILIAFILGFPANEIVVPIIIMAYMSSGALTAMSSLTDMQALLTANGWDTATAVSVILFSLMHWPCSTTLMTVKKETGSLKWTFLAAALPTACGLTACFVFNLFVKIFC